MLRFAGEACANEGYSYRRKYLSFGVYILITISSLIILSGWLSQRDLSLGESFAIYNVEEDNSLILISLSVYFLGLMCIIKLFHNSLSLKFIYNKDLASVYILYFVATVFFPIISSRNNYFELGYFLPPIVTLSLFLAGDIDKTSFLKWAKIMFGLMIFSSLLGAIIAPSKAVAYNYSGLGGFLSIRLYGIGMGATALGALCVAFLALVLDEERWTIGKFAMIFMALVAIVLCQSKTAWAGLFYLISSFALEKFIKSNNIIKKSSNILTAILAIAFFLFYILFIWFTISGNLYAADIEGAENLSTLSGRRYIWDTTIAVWRESPITGYGLGLWADDEFRDSYGYFRHAHNQFLHILASSGLIGLVFFLKYIYYIFKNSLTQSYASRIPINLFVLIIISCLTDVPFKNNSITDVFFIINLVILIMISKNHQRTVNKL